MGYCYEHGIGTRKNINKALTWYAKAAEHGDVDVQTHLAQTYYDCFRIEETEANRDKILKWTRMGAKLGNVDAQCKLGIIYYKGEIVEQNYDLALYWLKKAYEEGKTEAFEYIKEICTSSSNVYVRTVGNRQAVPKYMQEALEEELAILQECTELTSENLCSLISYKGYLPDFTTTNLRLADIYLHRCENIGKYGYGIFAKHNMFYVNEANQIVPVQNPDQTELSFLVDYEKERRIVLDNTEALHCESDCQSPVVKRTASD